MKRWGILLTAALIGTGSIQGTVDARTAKKIIGYKGTGHRAQINEAAKSQIVRRVPLPSINAESVTIKSKGLFFGKRKINAAMGILGQNDNVRYVVDNATIKLRPSVWKRAKRQLKTPGRFKRLKCGVKRVETNLRMKRALRKNGQAGMLQAGRVANGIPWSIARVNAPKAWGVTEGAGVKVAVMDTGIKEHVDLKKNIVARYDFAPDKGSNPSTWHDHGTHCSGTVAANGKIKGVAPRASLVDLRIFSGGSRPSTSVESIVKAFAAAVDQKVDVVNASWAGNKANKAISDAVANASKAGVITIAAAGDQYRPHVSFPARNKSSVPVTSVTANNDKSAFSSYGDEVARYGVTAYGANITSTIGTGGYAARNGTSMATSAAAGVMALGLAKAKTSGKKLTASQKASMLQKSGVDISKPYYIRGNVPKNIQGFGRVDAAKIVGIGK